MGNENKDKGRLGDLQVPEASSNKRYNQAVRWPQAEGRAPSQGACRVGRAPALSFPGSPQQELCPPERPLHCALGYDPTEGHKTNNSRHGDCCETVKCGKTIQRTARSVHGGKTNEFKQIL